MTKKTFMAAVSALAVAATALPASAETFRAATWNAAGSPLDAFLQDFAGLTREATAGALDFEVYPGGTLMPSTGSLTGLESGIAQIANITGSYFPAELPVDFVLADLSFIADDQMALAFAKTEVTFTNQQIQKELHDKNIVFATGFTIGIYQMICGFEAKSIEDFKGKKIRTASDAQVAFTKLIGGVAVSAPGNEIYTGIQRGSIDCTTGTPLYLTEFYNMADITKSVYEIPLGSLATGGYYFNKNFWQDRSLEEREAMMDSLSEATARSMIDWGGRIAHALDVGAQNNVVMTKPEPAAMELLQGFQKEFVANLAADSVAKRGIEDPSELIEQMVASIEKWKGLLAGVDRTNVEEVTALLNTEIFGKIDLATYGLD